MKADCNILIIRIFVLQLFHATGLTTVTATQSVYMILMLCHTGVGVPVDMKGMASPVASEVGGLYLVFQLQRRCLSRKVCFVNTLWENEVLTEFLPFMSHVIKKLFGGISESEITASRLHCFHNRSNSATFFACVYLLVLSVMHIPVQAHKPCLFYYHYQSIKKVETFLF